MMGENTQIINTMQMVCMVMRDEHGVKMCNTEFDCLNSKFRSGIDNKTGTFGSVFCIAFKQGACAVSIISRVR